MFVAHGTKTGRFKCCIKCEICNKWYVIVTEMCQIRLPKVNGHVKKLFNTGMV